MPICALFLCVFLNFSCVPVDIRRIEKTIENKTITVAYGNEDYFLHQEEKTFQGSVPQKADEIMLPQNYLDFLGKSYQAGDTISIDLTGTGQKAEYTLSGVLNNTKESNGYFIYVSKELAQDLAKDSFQVTAYTRLNTDAISSTAILNFAGKAIFFQKYIDKNLKHVIIINMLTVNVLTNVNDS